MKGSKLVAGMVGIILVLGLGVHGALALDYYFPTSVRVNNDPINQNYHYNWSSGMRNIAVYEDTVHAVWTDYRQGYPEVYLGTSLGGGISFTSNLKINDDPGSEIHGYPTLAIDNQGIPYIAWMDGRSGIWGIYFAKITGGHNPNTAVAVPGNPDDWAGFPTLSVSPSGDKVYLAWQESSGGQNRIKFARSLDGGTTFEAALDLTNGFYPAMVLGTGGEIYVAWMDWEGVQSSWLIYVAKSADGGQSFSAPVKVTANVPSSTMQFYPSLAMSPDGSLIVAWAEWRGSNSAIYLAKSSNGAASFGEAVPVSDAPKSAVHGVPSVAVDAAGNLYVAWDDTRSGYYQVYMAKSSDGGQSFGPGIMASQSLNPGHENSLPSLTVDAQGNAYMLWAGKDLETHIPEIYFGYGYNLQTLQNPPEVVIQSPAGAYVNTPQTTFSFKVKGGNSRGMTYSYRLNNESWSPWTSESAVTINNLGQGRNTFQVRAKDVIGQVSSTPAAIVDFTVDYTKPSLSIKRVLTRYYRFRKSVSISFRGSAGDDLSGLGNGSYRLITPQGETVAQGSLSFSSSGSFHQKIELSSSLLPAGEIKLVITVKDKAGNQTEYLSTPILAAR